MHSIPFPPPLQIAVQRLAHKAYPQEAGGFIIFDGSEWFLMESVNLHPEPKKHLLLPPEDFAHAQAFERTIFWHSHTQGQKNFSVQDVRLCKELGIPFYLFVLPDGVTDYFDPSTPEPYLKRPYLFGLRDCYSLVKDFYQVEFGITLDDFDRADKADFDGDGLQHWPKMQQFYESQGFVLLPDKAEIKRGDILLQQIRHTEPNHLGVVVDPSQNLFYHHLLDRESESAIYGGYWERVTVGFYRHKNL